MRIFKFKVILFSASVYACLGTGLFYLAGLQTAHGKETACIDSSAGNPCLSGSSSPNPNLGVGNPIHVVTGNKFQEENDITNEHGDIVFNRYYNSMFTQQSVMGVGWHYSYSRQLFMPKDNIQLVQDDGSRVNFHLPVNGIAKADRPEFGYLKMDNKLRKWEWVLPNGTVNTFDEWGRLIAVQVANGDSLSIQRYVGGDLDGLIEQITNNHGKGLYFNYLLINNYPVISSIETSDQRLLSYRYEIPMLKPYPRLVEFEEHLVRDYRQTNYGYNMGITEPYLLSKIDKKEFGEEKPKPISRWDYNDQRQAIVYEDLRQEPPLRLEIEYVKTPHKSGERGLTRVKQSDGKVTEFETGIVAEKYVIYKVKGDGCLYCTPAGTVAEYDSKAYLKSLNGIALSFKDGDLFSASPKKVHGWHNVHVDFTGWGKKAGWSSDETGKTIYSRWEDSKEDVLRITQANGASTVWIDHAPNRKNPLKPIPAQKENPNAKYYTFFENGGKLKNYDPELIKKLEKEEESLLHPKHVVQESFKFKKSNQPFFNKTVYSGWLGDKPQSTVHMEQITGNTAVIENAYERQRILPPVLGMFMLETTRFLDQDKHKKTIYDRFLIQPEKATAYHFLPEGGIVKYSYTTKGKLNQIEWKNNPNNAFTLLWHQNDNGKVRYGNGLTLKGEHQYKNFEQNNPYRAIVKKTMTLFKPKQLEKSKEVENPAQSLENHKHDQSDAVIQNTPVPSTNSESNTHQALAEISTDSKKTDNAILLQSTQLNDATHRVLGEITTYDHNKTIQNYGYNEQGQLIHEKTTTNDQSPKNTFYAWYENGQNLAYQDESQGQTNPVFPNIQRDASGLPVYVNGKTLHYNANNQLEEVWQANKLIAKYTYNAIGQRIAKTVNGKQTQYYYLDNHLVAEQNDQGQITRRYIYVDAVPIAMITYDQNKQPKIYYLHHNQVGQPILVTDENAQPQWQANATAFGKANITLENITFNLRLAGQYYDQETGWHQNLFRNYDPTHGHYLEPDPLGPLGRNDAYGYANQQPRRYIDPLGLIAFVFDGTGDEPIHRTNPYKLYTLYDAPENEKFYIPGPAAPSLKGILEKRFNPETLKNDRGQEPRVFPTKGTSTKNNNYTNFGKVYEWEQDEDLDTLPDSLAQALTLLDIEGLDTTENVQRTSDSIIAKSTPFILNYQWIQFIEYLNQQNQTESNQVIPIDMFGFSRGAINTMIFANRIAQYTDQNGYFEYTPTWRDKNGDRYPTITACLDLRFIGIFDAVSQIGLLNTTGKFKYDYSLSEKWGKVAHAIALNEHRYIMESTNFKDSNETPNPTLDNILVQQGFIGAHSDIGGGIFKTDGFDASSVKGNHMSTGWTEESLEYAKKNPFYHPTQNPYEIMGDLSDIPLSWVYDQAVHESVPLKPLSDYKDSDLTKVERPLLHLSIRQELEEKIGHNAPNTQSQKATPYAHDRSVNYMLGGSEEQHTDSLLGFEAREKNKQFLKLNKSYENQLNYTSKYNPTQFPIGIVDANSYLQFLEKTMHWKSSLETISDEKTKTIME